MKTLIILLTLTSSIVYASNDNTDQETKSIIRTLNLTQGVIEVSRIFPHSDKKLVCLKVQEGLKAAQRAQKIIPYGELKKVKYLPSHKLQIEEIFTLGSHPDLNIISEEIIEPSEVETPFRYFHLKNCSEYPLEEEAQDQDAFSKLPSSLGTSFVSGTF